MSTKDRLFGGASYLGGETAKPFFNLTPPPTEIFRVNPAPILEKGSRGLVISAPIKISGSSISVESSVPDPDELRHNLLFWDKLDWPQNNVIHIEGGPDIKFLEKEGVLQRSTMRFGGRASGGEIFRMSHLGAFKELDDEAPGQWALGRGVNSLSFDDRDMVEGRGILFDIYNAIPIPSRSVPLEDVLEFKRRRSSELFNLRSALDKVYQDILSAPDRPLAESEAIPALDRAIADHIKISREAKFPLKLSGAKAKLEWGVLGAGQAAFTATAVHLPLAAAILAGAGAATAASLASSVGLRDKRDRKTPYEYIVQIDKELG